MGTTLTGKIVAETYDSLLKVTDNNVITGTKKRITDGFGNDTPLLLSSTDVQIDGNLLLPGTTLQYVRGDGSIATFPTLLSADKLVTEVYNNSGATLTKGTIVYINGTQGNLPTIAKALATGDSTSAQTFGFVQTDITNMNNGYVIVAGKLSDLDTSAYTGGTQLYLSPTTAGTYTSTKPYAPNHLVYVGIVVRAHSTQGIIEVKIQNGYELDELHDVIAQTPSNNDGIFYNSTSTKWENKSIATALGYTPLSGSGTTNYVPKFTGSTSIGNSQIFDNGTNVGIGTTSPSLPLHVYNSAAALAYFESTNASGAYAIWRNSGTSFGDVGSALGISGSGSASDFMVASRAGSMILGTSSAERMRITSGGNVGIGTTSPTTKLNVYGGQIRVEGTDADLYYYEGTRAGTATTYRVYDNATNIYVDGYKSIFLRANQLGGSSGVIGLNGGNVGIGTSSPSYQLQLSTDSAAKPTSALWTIASDSRIKENITPYSKGLKELMLINPINYDYNGLGGFKKGKGGVGIIAQEILSILPDSVSSVKGKLNEGDKEETDILNFNGHELTYVLINAIKELKAELDELKNNK